MGWPTIRYATAARSSAWGYDKMNGIQDWLLRSAGLLRADTTPLDLPIYDANAFDFAVTSSAPSGLISRSVTLATGGIIAVMASIETRSAARNTLADEAVHTQAYVSGEPIADLVSTSAISYQTLVMPAPAVVAAPAGVSTVTLDASFLFTGRPIPPVDVPGRARNPRLWVRVMPF